MACIFINSLRYLSNSRLVISRWRSGRCVRLIIRLFRRLLCGLDGGFGWVGLYFGFGFSCSCLLRA